MIACALLLSGIVLYGIPSVGLILASSLTIGLIVGYFIERFLEVPIRLSLIGALCMVAKSAALLNQHTLSISTEQVLYLLSEATLTFAYLISPLVVIEFLFRLYSSYHLPCAQYVGGSFRVIGHATGLLLCGYVVMRYS